MVSIYGNWWSYGVDTILCDALRVELFYNTIDFEGTYNHRRMKKQQIILYVKTGKKSKDILYVYHDGVKIAATTPFCYQQMIFDLILN